MSEKKVTKRRQKLFLAWSMVALCAGLIFAFSAAPADLSNSQSGLLVGLLHKIGVYGSDDLLVMIVRKLAHFTSYGLLGALIYNAMRLSWGQSLSRLSYSVGFTMLYAVSDEFHQLFVPGRSGEPRDIVIDTVGAALGATIVYTIILRRSRQKSEKLDS